MTIVVTHHACERFVERVAPCSLDAARAHILESAKAIEAAARFGCEVVRRAHGERLVLQGETVVTVFGAHHLPHQCRRLRPFGDGEWL